MNSRHEASDAVDVRPFLNGVDHLAMELAWLDVLLRREVVRLRAAQMLSEDDFRGLYIPDSQVDAMLNAQLQVRPASSNNGGEPASAVSLAEHASELRRQIDLQAEWATNSGVMLPLVDLATRFGLSPFELSTLILCAAPAIDLRYQVLYAYVQNDVAKKHPTVDLAIKLFLPPDERLGHRSVFSPGAALIREGLIQVFADQRETSAPLLAHFMRADERIVDFLLGIDALDHTLLPFTQLVIPGSYLDELDLPPDVMAYLDQIAQTLETPGALICLHGAPGTGKEAAARALCSKLDIPLLVVDLPHALRARSSVDDLATCLRRELALRQSALYLSHFDAAAKDENSARGSRVALTGILSVQPKPLVFLDNETPLQAAEAWPDVRYVNVRIPMPDFARRYRLWDRALIRLGYPEQPEGDLSAVASKFTLAPTQVARAAQQAAYHAEIREHGHPSISLDDLHAGAREQSSQGLSLLAQKIETLYTWADIVLPPRTLQQLREVCWSVKHRHKVYASWGFEQTRALGRGLAILFSGASGTGKTMAAQVIAHELRLDLYKIDLSNVVSKYIGETEKNLSRIFEEAQASNAILFFDEADALFGKRSEVKDAHDRYANIEVAFLLTRLEEYEGIVMLATNLSGNLDSAFTRRMHHTVEFPFPSPGYREQIWRVVFPPQAPLAEDVQLSFLAYQFELAGGNIRNIALAAAFLAAEDGASITMSHLVLATARELRKLGRLPSKSEFGAYYDLVRELDEERRG